MITKTNQEGIFLLDLKQDLKWLHTIDASNVNINAHYASQLSFLNIEIRVLLQSSFHDKYHPACSLISKTPASATALLSGSTFIRNLGDCSIKFDCLQVMVAPNINSSDCFSRIPVKDINGNT